jgi:hypothetical protein
MVINLDQNIENITYNNNQVKRVIYNDTLVWSSATGSNLQMMPMYLNTNGEYAPLYTYISSGSSYSGGTFYEYNVNTQEYDEVEVLAGQSTSGLYSKASYTISHYAVGDGIHNCNKLHLTEVDIPRRFNNYDVKQINTSAFENDSYVQSITLPDGIKILNKYCFKNATYLTNLYLPYGIEVIEAETIDGTPIVSNPNNWSNGLLKIKTYIFKADPTLTVVTIDQDVTVCVERCFDHNLLQVINFNAVHLNDITSREWGIFRYYHDPGDSTLAQYPDTTLNIGSNVEYLPSYIFNSGAFTILGGGGSKTHGGIQFQSTFIIPNSITGIGKFAFYYHGRGNRFNATENSPLVIPSTVQVLNQECFSGQSGTYNITHAPEYYDIYTTYLPNKAFKNIASLGGHVKSVTLHSGLLSIGSECFMDQANSNFTSLTIPSTVQTIGASAFKNTTTLTTLIFEQPANMSLTLPTAGSSTGMGYCKSATQKTIYTDNLQIKNYDWASDNITATFYHLNGTSWE